MTKPKPTDIAQTRIRLPHGLLQQIEKLAKKNDRSLNDQITEFLETAVMAERFGVGGKEGVAMAVQGSSAMLAVKETLKQLGLDKPGESQSPPRITKTSE